MGLGRSTFGSRQDLDWHFFGARAGKQSISQLERQSWCLTTWQNSEEEEESVVCSHCPNDVHQSFSSSVTKWSSFISSKRELTVPEYPIIMLLEHSVGTSRLASLQAKEMGITYWSRCLGRCCSHQPIAEGKKVPLPCSSCGLCKASFGGWDPMLIQAKYCLF